ncbi:MAG: response regulator [Caulobacteraceae bacterium]|nr:response regulator [Caulobacteraceae bacterium]
MSESPSTKTRDLLLVEDNFGDAMLAQEAFGAMRTPATLSTARDGEEALQRLRREGPYAGSPLPDLVLLDMNLPQMDGLAVLRAIRSEASLRRLPVLVMTGSNAQNEIDACYEAGANGYIVKPMQFEALEEIALAIEQFWFGVAALPSPGAAVADRSHAA